MVRFVNLRLKIGELLRDTVAYVIQALVDAIQASVNLNSILLPSPFGVDKVLFDNLVDTDSRFRHP